MRRVFADTSFYIALLNPRDKLHDVAHEVSSAYRGHVTTSEYVLVELASYFSSAENRSLFAQFLKRIQTHPNTTIHFVSEGLFHHAMESYEKHTDKDWTLVDCISFLLMKQEGIQDALTADHHFEQAGFQILLKR